MACAAPIKGSYIAVYLPKVRTALSLCEVDVALGAGAASAASVSVTAANGSSDDTGSPSRTIIYSTGLTPEKHRR